MTPVTKYLIELVVWISLWQLFTLLLEKRDKKVQAIIYSLIFIIALTWLYGVQTKNPELFSKTE